MVSARGKIGLGNLPVRLDTEDERHWLFVLFDKDAVIFD
jgi:hypothetical protein